MTRRIDRRFLLPIVLGFTACASVPASTAEETVVVEAPEEEVDAETAFQQMVDIHLAARRSSLDECYLSDVLSGNDGAPASFDFAIRARPGTRTPVVRTLATTNPDKRILENCIHNAIASRPFPRREIQPYVAKVTVRAPDWVAAR